MSLLRAADIGMVVVLFDEHQILFGSVISM